MRVQQYTFVPTTVGLELNKTPMYNNWAMRVQSLYKNLAIRVLQDTFVQQLGDESPIFV